MIYFVGFIYICYIVLVLLYITGWRKNELETTEEIGDVCISVIIPFRNERQNLPILLSQLQNQSCNRNKYELIFVDDGSRDGSWEFLSKKLDSNIDACCLKNSGIGKKAAIATGLKHASFKYILTLDADIEIGKMHLSAFINKARRQEWDLIIGPVTMQGKDHGLWEQFQRVEFQSLATATAASAAWGKAVMCNGANLMFCKDRLNVDYQVAVKSKIASGDDMFLLEYARKENWNISYLKDESALALIKPLQILPFFKQRKRWASKVFQYRHPEIITTGLVVAGFNFLMLLNVCLAIFNFNWFALLFVFFILKLLVEWVMLKASSSFFRTSKCLHNFVLFALIQPIYILLSLLSALMLNSDWKRT